MDKSKVRLMVLLGCFCIFNSVFTPQAKAEDRLVTVQKSTVTGSNCPVKEVNTIISPSKITFTFPNLVVSSNGKNQINCNYSIPVSSPSGFRVSQAVLIGPKQKFTRSTKVQLTLEVAGEKNVLEVDSIKNTKVPVSETCINTGNIIVNMSIKTQEIEAKLSNSKLVLTVEPCN
jgi:hypothetical protein